MKMAEGMVTRSKRTNAMRNALSARYLTLRWTHSKSGWKMNARIAPMMTEPMKGMTVIKLAMATTARSPKKMYLPFPSFSIWFSIVCVFINVMWSLENRKERKI